MVGLATPTERERSQWYFQRYVAHLPSAGEMVLFDRSWYNRAGVERVMGYCSDEEYARFLDEAPRFEKSLIDDGLLLFNYWLAVDRPRASGSGDQSGRSANATEPRGPRGPG